MLRLKSGIVFLNSPRNGAGRFDAVIIEDTVAKGYLKDNKDLVGYVITENREEEAGSAIAFQKGSDLTEEFNAELKEMLENGEMEKLILKWFGGRKQLIKERRKRSEENILF